YCFFSTAQRLPRSTLFPYTTLFRSPRQRRTDGIGPVTCLTKGGAEESFNVHATSWSCGTVHCAAKLSLTYCSRCRPVCSQGCVRSEEHTSELQSRENLVCRLLLEKK